MKVQLFASAALMLLSAIPGALSAEHQHLHLKEAVAATAAAADSEGYEEKSPSATAKSFSLRGAVAAASAEDAADEDDELIQYGWGDWSGYRHRDWSKDIYGKRWGSEPSGKNPHTGKPYGAVAHEFCYSTQRTLCKGLPDSCKWRGNKRGCVPKNFEDEEFDSQDLQKFDDSEGDEVYSDYDEVDED